MTEHDNAALKEWLALAPKPPALEEGQRWHVFLSYRSVNRTWVLHLYDALRLAGFDVFLDQLEMAAGDSLPGRLRAALEASRSGVIVWSTRYEDSAWCLEEYDTMVGMRNDPQRKFRFVVIKLQPGAKLPGMTAKDLFLDFSDYPDGPRGGELLRLMFGLNDKPLSREALMATQKINEETSQALVRLKAAREIGDAALLENLAASQDPAWMASPLLLSTAAEALIDLKEYDRALHILAGAASRFPRATRPLQLEGLALARKGEQFAKRAAQEASLDTAERDAIRAEAEGLLARAQQRLGELYQEGHRDPETLGIYARTWMDRYNLTRSRIYLEKSRNIYLKAFELSPKDYYVGINAASKSILLGEIELGQQIAGKVEALVKTEPVEGNYWETATVAEVQLLRGSYKKAAALYRAAVVDAPAAKGAHDSTRRQAERLLAALDAPVKAREEVLAAFEI